STWAFLLFCLPHRLSHSFATLGVSSFFILLLAPCLTMHSQFALCLYRSICYKSNSHFLMMQKVVVVDVEGKSPQFFFLESIFTCANFALRFASSSKLLFNNHKY